MLRAVAWYRAAMPMHTPSPDFAVRNPDFVQRVRASFARQSAMQTLGASLAEVAPGRVVIEMPWSAHITQQNGFLHGGVVSTPLDSACGYAAMTLVPAGFEVLSVEFKVNFLAPAKGARFRFVGRVVKSGRTISVAEGQAFALSEGGDTLIASMSCTLMVVPDTTTS